jgi:hypothetical protein
MFCGGCGAQLVETAAFCPVCGRKVERQPIQGGTAPPTIGAVAGTPAPQLFWTPPPQPQQSAPRPPPPPPPAAPWGQPMTPPQATPAPPPPMAPVGAPPAVQGGYQYQGQPAAMAPPVTSFAPQQQPPQPVVTTQPAAAQTPAQPKGLERKPWSKRSKAMLAVGAVAMVAIVLLAMFLPMISSNNGGGSGAPAAPQGFNVQAAGGSNILSWNPVPGATSYRVYWSNTPEVSKKSSTGIDSNGTTYTHDTLVVGQTYYYLVTAVGAKGESKASATASGTPKRPNVSGTAIAPGLDYEYSSGLPCDGLNRICIFDLAIEGGDPVGTDEDSDPSFRFEVDVGKHYEILAAYNGGQVTSTITPRIRGDLTIDISFDSSVAENLILATEFKGRDFVYSEISSDLDQLIADANEAVARLNRAVAGTCNGSVDVDRLTDAVRSLTLNKLNNGSVATTPDFTPAAMRAFGGGLEGIRSLTQILNDPYPPMLPYVVFSRYNSNNEVDFGFSDIQAKKWDYIGSWGYMPHMATGGDLMACLMQVGLDEYTSRIIWGIKVKTFGSSEEWRTVTPGNMDCYSPCISPDQSRIVFSGRDVTDYIGSYYPWPSTELFVIDIDGSNLEQLTFDGLASGDLDDSMIGCRSPSWSPDGTRLVFSALGYATLGTDTVLMNSLEMIDPDGSDRRTVWDGNVLSWGVPSTPRYSPDGAQIIFVATEDYVSTEILIIPSDFDIETKAYYWRVTDNDCDEWNPSFSHNGRYLLYSSNRGGEKGYINNEPVDMQPFYLVNRWTHKVLTEYGNFAEAGKYYFPTLIGVCYLFTVKKGYQASSDGTVVIGAGETDQRTTDDHTDAGRYYEGQDVVSQYHDEIWAAANSISYIGSYSTGISLGCTSW